MIAVPCAECFGTGDAPFTVDLPHQPPCDSCGGSGENEIPGAALLRAPRHLRIESELITIEYVVTRLQMARSYMHGWEGACDDMLDPMMGPSALRYAQIRDY